MQRAKSVIFAALLTTAFICTNAWAFPHANIRAKETGSRDFTEGSSAVLSIALSHGCTHSGESYTTRVVTALFPNGADPNLSGIAYTNNGGTNYNGNALFGIKPIVDYNWKEIMPMTGNVPTYYNHGEKTTDVRAVHWHLGYIPDNFVGYATVSASLPKFLPDTCYDTIRVEIPVVQYCALDPKHEMDHEWRRDRVKKKNLDSAYAWIKEPTAMFPTETVVAAGYSAYLNIVRNLTTNPLPASCGGVGQAVTVYPTAADIDMYLPPHDGNVPGGGSGGGHMH